MRKIQDEISSLVIKIKEELKLSYLSKLNDVERLTFFLTLREELEEKMDKIEKGVPNNCSCGESGCKGKLKLITHN